jgi:hypothetical protein
MFHHVVGVVRNCFACRSNKNVHYPEESKLLKVYNEIESSGETTLNRETSFRVS